MTRINRMQIKRKQGTQAAEPSVLIRAIRIIRVLKKQQFVFLNSPAVNGKKCPKKVIRDTCPSITYYFAKYHVILCEVSQDTYLVVILSKYYYYENQYFLTSPVVKLISNLSQYSNSHLPSLNDIGKMMMREAGNSRSSQRSPTYKYVVCLVPLISNTAAA